MNQLTVAIFFLFAQLLDIKNPSSRHLRVSVKSVFSIMVDILAEGRNPLTGDSWNIQVLNNLLCC